MEWSIGAINSSLCKAFLCFLEETVEHDLRMVEADPAYKAPLPCLSFFDIGPFKLATTCLKELILVHGGVMWMERYFSLAAQSEERFAMLDDIYSKFSEYSSDGYSLRNEISAM